MTDPWAIQAAWAVGYYFALIALLRLSGKRLTGQTATFDLLVLIALAVALQQPAMGASAAEHIEFVAIVLGLHLAQSWLSCRWRPLRQLVRGKPRPLVRDGRIDRSALAEEFLSAEDLAAALRKQGHEDPSRVRLAVLEETGQISVVER